MKKIICTLVIIFLFVPIVKADLTEKQANDFATFTINFFNEGNKRIGSEGFPLFAYMQGPARIAGYQSKLYKVDYDYEGKIYVNANKWTFDCASFAAFIYYRTFNLVLTKGYANKTDPYSGLKLRSEGSNPYEVQTFFDDATNKEHFYFVKSNVPVKTLNYSELKKGDLIIIKGSHIMVYVGDGKIVHASNGAISNNNLGFEMTYLNTHYNEKNVYVIRVKDHVINPSLNCSTGTVFPDTNTFVELISQKPVEEKKNNYPVIKYSLSTNDWTKSLELKIELTDEVGLKSYTLNDSNNVISGKKYILNKTITSNGTYKIEVKNKNNLVKAEMISIKNIDNIAPIIEDIEVIEYEDYKKLVVKAIDNESGLDTNAYSFDSGVTWTYNSYKIKTLKEYEITVKDIAGNITKKVFNLSSKPTFEPKINNIIFGSESNNAKKVTITISDCDKCKIAITEDFKIPENKIDLNTREYSTYLSKGKYYVWLEYNGKIVDNKSFKVEFSKDNTILYVVLLSIISGLLIYLGVTYIRKHKKNEI